MKALPQPAVVRLAVNAVTGPENLYSSCFMRPQQLAEQVREIQVESRVVDAIRDAAAAATVRASFDFAQDRLRPYVCRGGHLAHSWRGSTIARGEEFLWRYSTSLTAG